jgi:hypothetical protein
MEVGRISPPIHGGRVIYFEPSQLRNLVLSDAGVCQLGLEQPSVCGQCDLV